MRNSFMKLFTFYNYIKAIIKNKNKIGEVVISFNKIILNCKENWCFAGVILSSKNKVF